jgi:hypothetical protein
MKYIAGIKYQLTEDEVIFTLLRPLHDIETELISLTTMGVLTLRKYWCFDGPSGPVFDSWYLMIAAAAHDAGYLLLRQGLLPADWRERIDEEYDRLAKDRIAELPAWRRPLAIARMQLHDFGLWIGGAGSADPANKRRVREVL